jgi:aryl-alcohol dehydrogenase-like predicted oxidoreductase
MVHTYFDHGGNLIETADIYNDGRAETIIGNVLRGLTERERSSLFIGSKGRFPVGVDPRDAGLSRRHLSRALDATLERLGVDHIDLYQLHAWDPITPLDESLDFLSDAVHTGKISYGGLSNFVGWQVSKAADYARGRFPLISMQPQYNLLVREVEYEIVPACIDAGLGLLPWSPLGGGWLTGKYGRDEPPAGVSRLGENPESTGMEAYHRRNHLAQTWEVIDVVRSLAEAHGVSMAQVSLAWVASRPGVSSVILGARTVDQLVDNLGAAELSLAPEEIAALDRVSDPRPADYPYGEPGVEQRSRTIE